jgi:hypothetical protein
VCPEIRAEVDVAVAGRSLQIVGGDLRRFRNAFAGVCDELGDARQRIRDLRAGIGTPAAEPAVEQAMRDLAGLLGRFADLSADSAQVLRRAGADDAD